MKKKTKTKKGVDIDGLGATAMTGKSDSLDDVDSVKRRGTNPPKTKRKFQNQPLSAATSPSWEGGQTKHEDVTMSVRSNKGESSMKIKKSNEVAKSLAGLGGFAGLFKGVDASEVAAAAQNEIEGEDDDTEYAADDEVEKGGEDTDQDELEAAAEDESEDETQKSDVIACPHCSSDITADDVRASLAKSGLGGSPKGKNKSGKKIAPHTAAHEEQAGFNQGLKNRNGKPRSGTEGAVRGAKGVAREPDPGNVHSYKGKADHKKGVGSMAKSEEKVRSPFGGQLMTIAKSTGFGSDEDVARMIAQNSGVDFDKLS